MPMQVSVKDGKNRNEGARLLTCLGLLLMIRVSALLSLLSKMQP